MSEPTRVVHVSIKGRVQGVGYRAWAADLAEELGLSGWVRNRRDGTVEALFSGPADHVALMLERCREGPWGARVSDIQKEEGGEVPAGFEIRATA